MKPNDVLTFGTNNVKCMHVCGLRYYDFMRRNQYRHCMFATDKNMSFSAQ